MENTSGALKLILIAIGAVVAYTYVGPLGIILIGVGLYIIS